MKELKPKTRDINVKRRQVAQPVRQTALLNNLSKREPIESKMRAIAALQPQTQEDVLQRSKTGWERLTAQARQINQLAAQLEEAMFELKVIANDVNREQRITQATKKPPKSICEYLTTIVPCVGRKKGGAFVLTTRKVDLFKAEREAVEIAQALRRQAKRRRVRLPINRQNKRSLLGWLT